MNTNSRDHGHQMKAVTSPKRDFGKVLGLILSSDLRYKNIEPGNGS